MAKFRIEKAWLNDKGGFVNVQIAGIVNVKFRIVKAKSDGSLYVFPPQSEGKDGKKFSDVFFPQESDRKELEAMVLAHYRAEMSGNKNKDVGIPTVGANDVPF